MSPKPRNFKTMELSYWQSRWNKDKTGWHMEVVYPQLPKLWPTFSLAKESRILVPFCGKSLDMKWLIEQGHYVIGVDAVEKALTEFIDSYPKPFSKDSSHGFQIYKSNNLELWQGDFLKLPATKVENIDAVYDKAALVAIPKENRKDYAQKIIALCNKDTHIFLQTFEYRQEEMSGPPFSVSEQEVKTLFGGHFDIEILHKQSKFDELAKFQQRGLSSYLIEKVYHLSPL